MAEQNIFDEWCGKHPKCKGCRFRGNECTAPEAAHKFDDWIEQMKLLIYKEIESDRLTTKD